MRRRRPKLGQRARLLYEHIEQQAYIAPFQPREMIRPIFLPEIKPVKVQEN